MQHAFIISIPEPCHENWDLMTPDEQGRHCAKCDKVVYDFTQMTDEELFRFLEMPVHGICGRYRNEQLNRPITGPAVYRESRIPRWQKIAACLAVLGGIGFTTVSAENRLPEVQTTEQTGELNPMDTSGRTLLFRGRVTDTEVPGRPVFCSLRLVNYDTGNVIVAVDAASGEFSFRLDSTKISNELEVHVVSRDQHFRSEYRVLKSEMGMFQEFQLEQALTIDSVHILSRAKPTPVDLTGNERAVFNSTTGLLNVERIVDKRELSNLAGWTIPGTVSIRLPLKPEAKTHSSTVFPGDRFFIPVQSDGLERRLITPVERMGEITE